MLFTLEALPARYGDALLLHYGAAGSPEVIVIDGGPPTVYGHALKPRLEKLRAARTSGEDALPIRMVMVSHIDDDHIRGVLDLTDQLVDCQQNSTPLPYDILTIWHNSFDDLLGNEADELRASLPAGMAPADISGDIRLHPGVELSSHGALVLASVSQGRKLRQNAERLGIPLNHPFGGLVAAPEAGDRTVTIDDSAPDGLRFTVIGPHEAQVKTLRQEWDKQLQAILKKEGKDRDQLAAEFTDTSVFNLSSIVVLAEAGGKKMLLTGDARGDFVIKGLEQAGLKQAGKPFHVDLLKLPHHGSDRNVAKEFFQQITADHYVVSSDGDKFKNPDLPTLKWLTDARQGDAYQLYLTYPRGGFAAMFPWPQVEQLLNEAQQANPGFKPVFRDQNAPSIQVNLGDTLTD